MSVDFTPGLVDFTITAVPESYAAQFVRRVALASILGSVRHDRVGSATLGLGRAWPARVGRLAEWGVPPAVSRPAAEGAAATKPKKWRMLNCRPSAAMCLPATVACGVPSICPHCWGRAMLGYWRTADRVLFAPPSSISSPAE